MKIIVKDERDRYLKTDYLLTKKVDYQWVLGKDYATIFERLGDAEHAVMCGTAYYINDVRFIEVKD